MKYILLYQRQIITFVVIVILSLSLVTMMAFAATYVDVDSIGIATDTPGAALGVKGAGIFGGFVSADYFTSTSTANSWLMGLLGVGTTTPTSKLEVAGGGLFKGILTTEGDIKVSNIAATSTASGFGTSSPYATLSVEIPSDGSKIPAFVVGDSGTSTPIFQVNNVGNISIGTTSVSVAPTQIPLFIDRSIAAGNLVWISNSNDGASVSAGFGAGKNEGSTLFVDMRYVGNGAGGTSLITIPKSSYVHTGSGISGGLILDAQASAPIIFGTGGTGLGNERARIDSVGNFGIVNKNPAELLDVAGRIAITNDGEFLLSNGFTATSSIRGEYGLLGFGSSTPFGQISIEASSTIAGSNTPIFVIGDSGSSSPFMYVSGINGNTGFGTDSPQATVAISNINTVNNFPALLVSAAGTGDGNIAIAVDASDVCKDADGSTAAACVLNDLAETFRTSEKMEPGDLAMIDPVNPNKLKKARAGNKNILTGVISTSPAIVFEGNEIKAMGGIYQWEEDKAPLALAGRVPVKVNLEGGEIKIGDPIAVSSVPGEGKKATKSGKIVGYALSEVINGKVNVFLQVGYWIAE